MDAAARRNPKAKPIFVMRQMGVSPEENAAVISGIKEMAREAYHVSGVEISVKDFGEWDSGRGDFESAEWYASEASKTGREGVGHGRQLNATNLISNLLNEPWKRQHSHYDIFVCSSDLWEGIASNHYLTGLAYDGDSAVLSVKRFRRINDSRLRRECVKTEAMHELGHVFGLVPESRKTNVEDSIGKHCTNQCIMRQGLVVPTDWVKITRERLLGYDALCPECRSDLKQYFRG